MVNESMFCPKCGKADQSPETFCRQCGNYLPDFDKPARKQTTPEEHLKATAALNLMTAIVSATLAILLYLFFFNRLDTPVIIYITAGFLIAIAAWQIQTFWRTMLLRKHFKKPKIQQDSAIAPPELEAKPTNQFLPEADFENIVPSSIVEKTTRKLKIKSEK